LGAPFVKSRKKNGDMKKREIRRGQSHDASSMGSQRAKDSLQIDLSSNDPGKGGGLRARVELAKVEGSGGGDRSTFGGR